MAIKCSICGKKAKTSLTRSHSHIGTKRKQYPNIQKISYKGKKIKVCTTCLKRLFKK